MARASGASAYDPAVPVAFDCACGTRWWSPPQLACPTCGPEGISVPDPVIWSVGAIPETRASISAQLRDPGRFETLVDLGFELFVDVAGDMRHVWRPDAEAIRGAGVQYVRIRDVEDLNFDLPAFAFHAVSEAIEGDLKCLIFCAAGLKRSPHLAYGALRRRGLDADVAWSAVSQARPFADKWPPYLDAAEGWLRGERLGHEELHR